MYLLFLRCHCCTLLLELLCTFNLDLSRLFTRSATALHLSPSPVTILYLQPCFDTAMDLLVLSLPCQAVTDTTIPLLPCLVTLAPLLPCTSKFTWLLSCTSNIPLFLPCFAPPSWPCPCDLPLKIVLTPTYPFSRTCTSSVALANLV